MSDPDGLIERLRAVATALKQDRPYAAQAAAEAADALVSLHAEVGRLRGALEPFATFAVNVDATGWTSNIHREQISTWFGPSDFRDAATALNPEPSP